MTNQPRLNGRFLPLATPEYEVLPGGCWQWQRSFFLNGYGQAGPGVLAHRMMYKRLVGPIADGLQIDHLCRNKACVNPDHMEPVTNAVNTRRGAQAKTTQAQVDEIRRRHAAGEGPTALGREFGMSATSICRIVSRRRWA